MARIQTAMFRSDRACADEAWRDTFPLAKVVHLTTSCSDHCPLLIHLEGLQDQQRRPTSLRYEIMWERDTGLPQVIADAWNKHKTTGGMGSVARSLREVLKDMKEWSKKKFGNVFKDIERLRTQLTDQQMDGAHRTAVWDKMNQLDELLYREEMLWLQRSRITWLKEGERNTKYLHRRAVWRARQNLIQRLRKQDGTRCSVPSDMERMAHSYFKEVFTKDPTLSPDVVLDCIVPKVTEEMNVSLCRPYSDEEISNALFQIRPLKAPGCDGLPARFFQRN